MKRWTMLLLTMLCLLPAMAADSKDAPKPETATPAAATPATGGTKTTPAYLTENFKKISPNEIPGNLIKLVGGEWMLITAGSESKFNSMTASWGGFGVWNKPVAFILVMPTRYTYEFLEREDYYTLTFFDDNAENGRYRALMRDLFGKKSGRDTDKVKESGLTPLFLPNGITYQEARIVVVCKKGFNTPTDRGHKLYFGEIVEVWLRK